MTGKTCPVQGCDYGEQADKSMAAVRAHINASGDDAHDWQDLKGELAASGGDQEAAGKQSEATENEENEDDDTMPTDQEYRQQYEGDGEQGNQSDDGGSDAGGGGFSIPSLDRSTMLMLLAVAAVLVVLYVWMGDGDSVESGVDAADDSDDDGAVSDEEVSLLE